MKKIRIAAAGDNCMDVYDKENKAVRLHISDRWVQMLTVSR